MKKLIALSLFTVLVSLAPVVRGEVVFYDNFDYLDGSITANSSGVWTNHSGTGTFIQITNGVANTISGSGSREDVGAILFGEPYTTGTLYAGFDLTLAQDFSGAGDYFFHFKDAGNTFRGRVFVVDTNGLGDFSMGIDNDAGSASFSWGEGLTVGNTYRIVLGYDLDANTSSLWVNPVNIGSSNIVDTVAASAISISRVALRQGGVASGVQQIDNLVVATTFTEVLTPVPEPSQIAMFGLGALGLLAYRLRSARRR